MSMVNRAAGRSGKNKTDTHSVSTKHNVTAKQPVLKTENVKVVEKEKKQPTADQIRLATLTDKGEINEQEIQIRIERVKDITCKTDDEIAAALHDCDFNVDETVAYLIEGRNDGWSTTKRKKKSRAASASKNEADVNTHGETNDNAEDWDKGANSVTAQQSDKSSRGFRGRRGGSSRPNDRGSFNNNRRWRGRENKENERSAEDGTNATSTGRDYRGRGDRVTNGPPRFGRGSRGPRGGGRGSSGTRTFQSRDSNDRSGGFPHQIDTWNNPDTENTVSKVDEFPSPEDWDNEEYTGSLADSKVFTPSTAVEPDGTSEAVLAVESEVKEESIQYHMSIQGSSNATIPSMVVGSNQLTAAQTQYFNQLAAQASENRKQAQQNLQQSTPTKPQQTFAGVSQSYPAVNASQSYTSMVTSQTFPQSPSSISGSASYSRTSSEYTPSNYDVMNYNSMVGLQNNGALPQRSKPQRPSSRQETPTKVIPSNVDLPSAEGGMNAAAAMKYLDGAFSALDFSSSDNFDSSVGTDEPGVAALTNKYSPNVATNAAAHAELPVINTFQGTQPAKSSHPSSNISSVLNQNKLSESSLQGESVYSSQTISNSRIAPSIQELKSNAELPYGMAEAYQSPQPSAFQKSSVSVSSSFHQPGTSITSTASNVYSTQQTQQSQQQQQQQPQPQSQISGTGVTYSTNNSSPSSFSVYSSSNSHSVATATPPLHNSVYHNSSYQPHPSVSASFQSYMSYPSSLIPPYQAGAAGLTQTPYLNTQYGGGSLASLGATFGAAPFPNSYGVGNSMQTPVATLQNHKISSSLSTGGASKDSQYDSLQAITSASGSLATTSSGSVISGLSQTSTTTSSKVSSSSSSGSKSSGMLPNIPPGVTPLIGPAAPQYIMSQGTLPMYQPAFALNYDELQYIPRGMHPHMPSGYLDINYATPQTNMAPGGRETLNVPFSSMSDGRFSRPDNTTSPVPPSAAAAAGASLSQQNTAAAHQQPHVPMLQTYAYIYPPYQQYTAPVYQVAQTATAAGPGASNNAAMTGAQYAAKAPAGYSSTGYASQFESLGSNQVEYSAKVNSSSSYSSGQAANKASNNAAAGVTTQNSSTSNAELSMYAKSHASLAKSYESKTYHSNTPPPFTMTGGGTSSSGLGNATNAAGYAPQLFISNVPTAAAAHQQHHMHQTGHHPDGADMRSSGTNDRNYFLSNNRSYR